MTAVIIDASFPRNYKNFGQYAEQALAYTLTGEIRKADGMPFYAGSDIPDFNMSVKSSGFTLASGRQNVGDTFDEKVDDFMNRVHSDKFAYVSQELKAYIMNKTEFRQFIYTFCYMGMDSMKNGGLKKIQCLKESKKMKKWLEDNLTNN